MFNGSFMQCKLAKMATDLEAARLLCKNTFGALYRSNEIETVDDFIDDVDFLDFCHKKMIKVT